MACLSFLGAGFPGFFKALWLENTSFLALGLTEEGAITTASPKICNIWVNSVDCIQSAQLGVRRRGIGPDGPGGCAEASTSWTAATRARRPLRGPQGL